MKKIDLEKFNQEAAKQKAVNKAFLNQLKRKKPKTLDEDFETAHDKVFEKLDCLTCANCCKTTSPIFREKDIQVLAKRFKIKVATFIEQYLFMDTDGFYALRSAPCPFLDDENYCTVYEDRPLACREYPHTNRKRMYQVLDLTYLNTLVCPATLKIVEQLREAGQ